MDKKAKKEVILLTRCCCFTLKTGTIVFSIIDVVLNIVAIVLSSMFYNELQYVKKLSNRYPDLEFLQYLTITIIIKQIIEMITNFILVCCSQKNMSILMKKWVSLKKNLLYATAAFIWFVIWASFSGSTIGVGCIALLIGNIFIAGGIYSWLVIYNRYREIKNEDPLWKTVSV